MSQLKVDQISKADGTQKTNTDYVLSGSAKAMGNIDQTSTQAIYDSLNISSILDPGTGQTGIQFTNSFVNDKWKLAGSGNSSGTAAGADIASWSKTPNDGIVVARAHSTGAPPIITMWGL